MWDNRIFLRRDVKRFFARVCADELTDEDIAAIISTHTDNLAKRNEVSHYLVYVTPPSHMRSLLLLAKLGKT